MTHNNTEIKLILSKKISFRSTQPRSDGGASVPSNSESYASGSLTTGRPPKRNNQQVEARLRSTPLTAMCQA